MMAMDKEKKYAVIFVDYFLGEDPLYLFGGDGSLY
jgi:hypothetical protein